MEYKRAVWHFPNMYMFPLLHSYKDSDEVPSASKIHVRRDIIGYHVIYLIQKFFDEFIGWKAYSI